MNNIGFPNTDIYSEHEQGGAESFWPSFTDIMMVIVMVFLMITVAVILNNWELMNNLKSSVEAERLAMAKAQSALQVVEVKAKENETLEERLSRLESLLSTRTQNLQLALQQQQQTNLSLQKSQQAVVAAQATIQNLEQQNTQKSTLLTDTQQLLDQQKQQVLSLQQEKEALQQEKDESVATTTSLQQAMAAQQQQLTALQQEKEDNLSLSQQTQDMLDVANKELENKSKELEQLRQKDVEGHEQLLSLKGEFEQLDKKYQKLLRPARSSKNKHVVRVVFNKVNDRSSYQLGEKDQPLVTLSRSNLDKTLSQLKEKYGNDLYVKIIIPASSNVSHADAWRFTSEMLTQYDYYHADDPDTTQDR